jgi:hypothetical protein
MPKKTAAPNKKELGFLATNNLVGVAMAEYYEKHEQVMSELDARAQALFTRIAPEKASFAECYHEGDERVFCDVVDLMDGFGTLSLSFHKGVTPEADYFLIANYVGIPSQIRIYTLYDLGRALCEVTKVAQSVCYEDL